MGYSNPRQSITYTYAAIDFGAGDKAASFKGPKGMAGKLKDIVLPNVTETFNAVTTPAHVKVGSSTDDDHYADANLGTTAATDTFVATQNSTTALILTDLPADTQIEVAFIAPTGGTPAGIADVNIVVDWY